jgi:aminoglycoside phosphotransferase (APT) family kinase protein
MSRSRLRAIGALLARVHAVPPPPVLPQATADSTRTAAIRCVEDLSEVHPELGARARACITALPEGRSIERQGTPAALLHGDLHFDQVLFQSDGPAFVDWDRSGVGSPASDLGTLHAHLLARHPSVAEASIYGILDGYVAQGGVPDRDEIRWYRAHALLRLVNTPYRAIRPDWVRATEAIIEEAAASC